MAFRRTFGPAIINPSNVKGLRNSPSEELVVLFSYFDMSEARGFPV